LTGHFGYLYSWYAFKAPEIDQSFAHDRSVDVWSLGAILYMMLTGLPPFRGDGMELVDAKHAGIFDFELVVPSGGAQRLTRRMLNIMPEERYTIHDILHDPWMEAENGYLEQFDLDFAREQNRDW
jgi:serine/threonine protein kinase